MKSNLRKTSLVDRLITGFDHCLRAALATPVASDKPHPDAHLPPIPLSTAERKHVAGLMRINHTGEVCAQALYLGQSLTARNPRITEALKEAAHEESAHLAWCHHRLTELNAKSSFLNPLWFVGSLSIGIVAGLLGDEVNLGFLSETENQVVRHLDKHLSKLPKQDLKSRAILEQMRVEEAQHATVAVQQGAIALPDWAKAGMHLTAKIMTSTVYYV